MSNNHDSLMSHLSELKRKHRELDEYINSFKIVTDEVRRLKTQKLWLKDEISRLQRELSDAGIYLNGQS